MLEHAYDERTFLLNNPPGNIQALLLDRYRATDAFRDSYASYMLSTQPDGPVVTAALDAARKFLDDKNISLDSHGFLIGDMLYTRWVLNFKYWEYFAYGLRDMTIDARLEFIPEGSRRRYTKVLNPDKQRNLWFSDKSAVSVVLAPWYKRDMLTVNGECTLQAFQEFCQKHPRFVAKPPKGSLGKGVEIIDINDQGPQDLEAVFKRFQSEERGMFCEEFIEQDSRLAVIHPESVNTVRVVTYLSRAGRAKAVTAYLRSGRGASIVDNADAGGIFAAVDVNTGIVTTNAVDEHGRTYTVHPDTGFTFRRFAVPDWEELLELLGEAAQAVPDIRLIGWDVALASDGWKIVEGNCQSQHNVVQIATRTGLRKQLEKDIEWEANRKATAKGT